MGQRPEGDKGFRASASKDSPYRPLGCYVGRGHGGLCSQTSQGTVFIHLFNTHLGRSGIVPSADDTAENQANQASAPRSSDSIQQESQTPDTGTLLFWI